MKKFLLTLLVAPFMGSVQANAQGNCQADYQLDDSNCPSVSFTDNSVADSTSQIVFWSWDFGDGNTSLSSNPTHTYASQGWFLICLTIETSNSCMSTICDTVVIDCSSQSECEADFYFSSDSTGNCETINFFDLSTSNTSINEWAWDFGDGNTSTLENPTHTYANDGSYTVCVTITATDSCVDTYCETVEIDCNGQQGCNADFFTIADSTVGCPSFGFYDLSTSSTSINEWSWDFGDGNTSTSQSPSNTYAANGTYVICLSITAADSCVTTYCETIVIDCIAGLNSNYLNNLTVSPNPAQNVIQLNLPQANSIEFQIIGLNGAVCLQGARSAASTHAFIISDLDAGMYLMQLNIDGATQVIRFIKE